MILAYSKVLKSCTGTSQVYSSYGTGTSTIPCVAPLSNSTQFSIILLLLWEKVIHAWTTCAIYFIESLRYIKEESKSPIWSVLLHVSDKLLISNFFFQWLILISLKNFDITKNILNWTYKFCRFVDHCLCYFPRFVKVPSLTEAFTRCVSFLISSIRSCSKTL